MTPLLDQVQREAFNYFLGETNRANGLVRDKTRAGWPASIAAVGLALTCYPVGVERGFITRSNAVQLTLATLRFFAGDPGTGDRDSVGHQGFYYHFLDMHSGRRAMNCEVSTVDSALLLAGVLTAAAYFTRDSGDEREIRDRADLLYRRTNWSWAQNDRMQVTQGWRPESGFVEYWYQGYDEALILYLLGLGTSEVALAPQSYAGWTASYECQNLYGIDFLYAGPLFIHQLSHVWVDFRGIRDPWMREHDLDYFENSRRATLVQQRYAIENPLGFDGYGEHAWGITASDGPGPARRKIRGIDRQFHDYVARGVPHGPDDGTLSPSAVIASLPFAPDVVLPTMEYMDRMGLRRQHRYGFRSTYNPTFGRWPRSRRGWLSPYCFGINQGPIVLMIENHRTGLIWELMRNCPYLRRGLRRAGFAGGWLDKAAKT
jgi:hypothetical protein